MPGTIVRRRNNVGQTQGMLRELLIQHQKVVTDLDNLARALRGDVILVPTVLSRGSTDTNLANTAFTFSIAGVPVLKAAVAAGTALGALGTIAASKWSIIAVDIIAAGTVTFSVTSGFAAGYATEALAIAAMPPRVAGKARVGYFTVLATASTWIAGTDALAGGATGNPATTTNYYPADGCTMATGADAYGMVIPTTLARGSTDTNVATIACSFNIAGVPYTKAAVAAGTAFGALGTVPIDKWAIYAVDITSAGVISYVTGADNFTTGYGTEAQALNAVPGLTSGKARMGYLTVKTKSGTTFVTGTDGLAGGSSGNVASQTNYYAAAGETLSAGITAAKIANEQGVVVTS